MPIGHDCRLTHHVRQAFGVRVAYPFDWWTSPLAGLTTFLEAPDADLLIGEDLLEPVWHEGRLLALRNIRFGFELIHDFPREGRTILPGWQDHIGEVRAKVARRLDRFLDLGGRRLLFVRSVANFERKALGKALPEAIGRLKLSLDGLFRGAEIDLLVVDAAASGKGLISVMVQDTSQEDWIGDAPLWRRRLSATGCRLAGLAGEDLQPLRQEDED